MKNNPVYFLNSTLKRLRVFFRLVKYPQKPRHNWPGNQFSIRELYSLLSSKGEAPHFSPNIAYFFGIFLPRFTGWRLTLWTITHDNFSIGTWSMIRFAVFFTRSHSHRSLALRLQKRHWPIWNGERDANSFCKPWSVEQAKRVSDS